MIKTMTNGEIRNISFGILDMWEREKGGIKLGSRELYHLIGVKKKLEEVAQQLNETIMLIGTQHGGEITPQGTMKFPEESMDELNTLFNDLSAETTEIEYSPIKVKAEDIVPASIMELLFDFIEIVEE